MVLVADIGPCRTYCYCSLHGRLQLAWDEYVHLVSTTRFWVLRVYSVVQLQWVCVIIELEASGRYALRVLEGVILSEGGLGWPGADRRLTVAQNCNQPRQDEQNVPSRVQNTEQQSV